MANNKAIQKAEPQAIEIHVQTEDTDRYNGLQNVTMKQTIIKHNYLGQMFDVPENLPGAKNGRVDSFQAMVIAYRNSVRRNYESDYDESNPTPPTCYSVDSKQGSRAQEFRNLPMKDTPAAPRRVYGECSSCFFSRFRTGASYKAGASPQTVRAGQQCSSYGLCFVVLETGEMAVLQVPPTSATLIGQDFTTHIQKNAGSSLQTMWWEFHAAGGGRAQKGIMVLPVKGVSQEDYKAIKNYHSDLESWIDQFVENFASGGNKSEEEVTTSLSGVEID